ncbi:virulence RhuM family protein, partial [Ruminococcaceae bacterium OttesenSCG-928-O06]|nr:virulence RhuM family protein [Ruminococcaceae bacterium OttesenSCG-928-O06]
NKMHYSVHGKTAAEMISARADADKPNMGLTTYKGAKVRKADVAVAKNYLSEEELTELNRIVTMYLDYAEDQAQRQMPMHMADWEQRLNAFLQFNGREVLQNAGTISKELAQEKAEQEYQRYDEARRLQGADIDGLEKEAKALSKKP